MKLWYRFPPFSICYIDGITGRGKRKGKIFELSERKFSLADEHLSHTPDAFYCFVFFNSGGNNMLRNLKRITCILVIYFLHQTH